MSRQASSILLLYGISYIYKQKSNKQKYIIILLIPKIIIFFFFLQHIIMAKATEYKLKKKKKKRKGIMGHQNKPNKELLTIIYKLKCITENLLRSGL